MNEKYKNQSPKASPPAMKQLQSHNQLRRRTLFLWGVQFPSLILANISWEGKNPQISGDEQSSPLPGEKFMWYFGSHNHPNGMLLNYTEGNSSDSVPLYWITMIYKFSFCPQCVRKQFCHTCSLQNYSFHLADIGPGLQYLLPFNDQFLITWWDWMSLKVFSSLKDCMILSYAFSKELAVCRNASSSVMGKVWAAEGSVLKPVLSVPCKHSS